jgi:hypothetical protein
MLMLVVISAVLKSQACPNVKLCRVLGFWFLVFIFHSRTPLPLHYRCTAIMVIMISQNKVIVASRTPISYIDLNIGIRQ